MPRRHRRDYRPTEAINPPPAELPWRDWEPCAIGRRDSERMVWSDIPSGTISFEHAFAWQRAGRIMLGKTQQQDGSVLLEARPQLAATP